MTNATESAALASPGVATPAADPAARALIASGFRLQWEEAQQAYVLLFPEGLVRLNGTAAAILTRCDGRRTIAGIIDELEQLYAAGGLAQDVRRFLALAARRGWVELMT